ncbi:MAG: HIT domain-containing protein [Candidatus Aenigmarchaeota archaeon]|nr:HIT domain-containing protein [Candidatus Aenigmarchaeota archaeon]NIQ17524.1 HIT domain-containing protein [Candidatus Aenigmarchaeota archaeon]NIS73102.1 HIT domain-containing protein [Candidatus Aenigmarchaeota archaeon]
MEEECLFCKIVAGEIPSEEVYSDGDFIAFLDINPRNPGHTLVIPRKHYNTILEMPDSEVADLSRVVKKIAIAVKKGTNADGISIGQSNERAAGQVIPHVHFHVIPRFASEGPPGLESIIPTKKLTPEIMKKLTETIKANFGSSETAPAKKPEKLEKTEELREELKEEDFEL